MSELFGTKYFGFILSAYGITFVVLALMIIWVLATYSRRKRDLARMEEAGLKRASRTNG